MTAHKPPTPLQRAPYRGEPWRMGSLASERASTIYEGERVIRHCASPEEAEAVVLAHNRYIAEPLPAAPDLDDDSEDALGPQGLGPVEEHDE